MTDADKKLVLDYIATVEARHDAADKESLALRACERKLSIGLDGSEATRGGDVGEYRVYITRWNANQVTINYARILKKPVENPSTPVPTLELGGEG